MDFEIPQQKDILVSIANAYSSVKKNQANALAKKEIYDSARSKVDQLTRTDFMIDGIDMSSEVKRVRSDFFDLGNDEVAIADGYWYHIKAGGLTKGMHTIRRSCNSSMGKFASTDYNIRIV